MHTVTEHDIHDPRKFQKCAKELFSLPDELYADHCYPSINMSRSACLYEAPSVNRPSEYPDGKPVKQLCSDIFPFMQNIPSVYPQTLKLNHYE
jgi:hypothetical protein